MSGYVGPNIAALARQSNVNDLLPKPLVSRDIAQKRSPECLRNSSRADPSRVWHATSYRVHSFTATSAIERTIRVTEIAIAGRHVLPVA